MAKATFNFGDDVENPDPPSFDLFGKTTKGDVVGPFEFHCIGHLNEIKLSQTLAAIEQNAIIAIGDILSFIRYCLVDEDVAEFDDLLARKDVNIDSTILGNVMKFLVEDYAKRPTQAPSVSSVGPTPTGITSTGAASGKTDEAPSA